MARYYDYVLGLIPLAMVGVTAFMIVSGFTTPVAVGAASAATLGLMGHAMFVHAPLSTGATAPTAGETVVDAPAQGDGVAPQAAD